MWLKSLKRALSQECSSCPSLFSLLAKQLPDKRTNTIFNLSSLKLCLKSFNYLCCENYFSCLLVLQYTEIRVWGNEIENRTGTVICYIRKYCDAVRTRWFLRDKRGHCQRGYENVHWLSCFTHACENQAAATASVKKGNAAGFWRHTFREGRQRPSFHDEDIMWKFGQLFGAMRKCLMPWCRRRRFMLPIKTNVRGHFP